MAKIVDYILPDGTKIKIKEGSTVIKGSDVSSLGIDTVAIAIAKAEGKNPALPLVLSRIKKRIGKP